MTSDSREQAPVEQCQCPECNGSGKSGMVPLHVRPVEGYKPTEQNLRDLAAMVAVCHFCDGKGSVPPEQLAWRAIGESWRKARREKSIGMREWAERVGASPGDYCQMENGRIKPDPRYSPLAPAPADLPSPERPRIVPVFLPEAYLRAGEELMLKKIAAGLELPDKPGPWIRHGVAAQFYEHDGKLNDVGGFPVEEYDRGNWFQAAPVDLPSANTQALIDLLKSREAKGIATYGTTLDRTDLLPQEWMQHAIEELLDGAAYLNGLKRTWTHAPAPADLPSVGLIYLASPYSHADTSIRDQRFAIVCRAAARLMSEGHLIFSPIAHTHPIAMAGSLPTGWDFWQKYDHAQLDTATEMWVLRLDGWDESKGVTGEIEYMRQCGKPVKFIDPSESDLTPAQAHGGDAGLRESLERLAVFEKWKRDIEDSGDKDGWAANAALQHRLTTALAERDEAREKLRKALAPAVAEVCLKPSRAELQREIRDLEAKLTAAEHRLTTAVADKERAQADLAHWVDAAHETAAKLKEAEHRLSLAGSHERTDIELIVETQLNESDTFAVIHRKGDIRHLLALLDSLRIANHEERGKRERAEAALAKWESDPLDKQEANPIDRIAVIRGWMPLVPGEIMTVHFNRVGYQIQREPADLRTQGQGAIVEGVEDEPLPAGTWLMRASSGTVFSFVSDGNGVMGEGCKYVNLDKLFATHAPAAQDVEHEADADIAAGHVKVFDSMESLIADLPAPSPPAQDKE